MAKKYFEAKFTDKTINLNDKMRETLQETPYILFFSNVGEPHLELRTYQDYLRFANPEDLAVELTYQQLIAGFEIDAGQLKKALVGESIHMIAVGNYYEIWDSELYERLGALINDNISLIAQFVSLEQNKIKDPAVEAAYEVFDQKAKEVVENIRNLRSAKSR